MEEVKILRKSDLDQSMSHGCTEEGCTNDENLFFIHSNCHPEANPAVFYTNGTGLLNISCAICDEPIATIRVAE